MRRSDAPCWSDDSHAFDFSPEMQFSALSVRGVLHERPRKGYVHMNFCLSSRVLHPDQSGILSRLLWSLHHNYGAVGTGEIRDGKKRKSGKKRQMKCRSVEMCSGQFLSLFLSVSLSPWATAKEAKRDRG